MKRRLRASRGRKLYLPDSPHLPFAHSQLDCLFKGKETLPSAVIATASLPRVPFVLSAPLQLPAGSHWGFQYALLITPYILVFIGYIQVKVPWSYICLFTVSGSFHWEFERKLYNKVIRVHGSWVRSTASINLNVLLGVKRPLVPQFHQVWELMTHFISSNLRLPLTHLWVFETGSSSFKSLFVLTWAWENTRDAILRLLSGRCVFLIFYFVFILYLIDQLKKT